MPDQHVEDRAWLFNVTDYNQLEEGIMRDPGATSVFGEKTMLSNWSVPKFRADRPPYNSVRWDPPLAHTDLGASMLPRLHLDHNP